MATLVLGTVGRVFGGPLGGIIGTAVGGFVDRGIQGGGPRGDASRIGNLTVQSAAYGEAIPVVTGRVRAAGNLIWSNGITETAGSGSGKRNGAASSAYRYTASFAVGLAAREIAGVGRIWADGRLIRDEQGVFLAPTIMRLYRGDEGQAVDPLIAAAEGATGTPAYRGTAYAVFEDLALADFGNRIPNLTFEIVGDDTAAIDLGRSIDALTRIDGRSVASVAGSFAPVAGHFAGTSGSVADAVTGLIELAGASVVARTATTIVAGVSGIATVPVGDTQSRNPEEGSRRERQRRAGSESRLEAVEIGYFDTERDYQPGLQRARRSTGNTMIRQALACAMTADQAKSLAQSILGRSQAARLQCTTRLPWRYLWLQPGAHIRLSDSDDVWRVREVRFEAFVVSLDLERVAPVAPIALRAASGRALAFDDQPAGPTVLHVLDVPPLPGEAPTAARLWIAASGASTGWRRAGLEISLDDGASYRAIGTIEGGSVIGVATTRLETGSVDDWDRISAVDVELLADRMWLEDRSETSVLAGANLALIGNELVGFTHAEALSARRFRLSGLWRGRYGSQASLPEHMPGDRFILVDPAAMIAVDLPAEMIGREIRVRATGTGDGATLPVKVTLTDNASRILAP